MDTNVMTSPAPKIDFGAIKKRQHTAWSSGDYAIIGTTLQIVGESLCEAVDVRSSQRVLDVAAGNGNATLAAARRFADVVSTDYVSTLLERGRERANAERLDVTFKVADADALPFAEGTFDVVLSTFGAMFTPSQEHTAGELARVCRPQGKIGLANWTPDGFIGRLFKLVGHYVPPPPGMASPALWGDAEHLVRLFQTYATPAKITRKQFMFRYRSARHWLNVFSTYYGPVLKAFEALDDSARKALEMDLLAFLNSSNVSTDGTLVIPSDYLEAVFVRNA